MRGRDAITIEEWEAADHTPVYAAQRLDIDGTLPVWDLILEAAVGVIFDFPKTEFLDGSTLNFTVNSSDPTGVATAESILQALLRKHVNRINSKGERQNMHVAAREVVIDILANTSDWKSYSAIFAAFAELNDQNFFEQLVRGKQRKRKKAFNDVEWFCMVNWHQWSARKVFRDWHQLPPTLKFWTDESIVQFIDIVKSFHGQKLTLKLPGLRSIRTRLGLEQVKPALVTKCFVTTHGKLRIEWKGP